MRWLSVIALVFPLLQARAQVPITSEITCKSFASWKKAIYNLDSGDARIIKRGRTSDVFLIKDSGYHPRTKKNYDVTIHGYIVRLKNKKTRAQFSLEAQTRGDQKPLVERHFKGTQHTWFSKKKTETNISLGKKILVWAGTRGPQGSALRENPNWLDLFHKKGTPFQTLVGKRELSMGEGGTIYYYPEGILEIFSQKQPLTKQYNPKRIFLWSGGCSENTYPSPWPKVQ